MINKEYYNQIINRVTAVIDKGCEFKGDMIFDGVVRLGGNFEGRIFSNDVLIIEETAFVKAEIEADTVVISGKVLGNINAKTRIEIFRPAIVKGNISAPTLVMEEGVIFDGESKMGC